MCVLTRPQLPMGKFDASQYSFLRELEDDGGLGDLDAGLGGLHCCPGGLYGGLDVREDSMEVRLEYCIY
jgi:hypothetical protein